MLTRTLLVLALMGMTASPQPMFAASGGSGSLALVIDWVQVAMESLLEWTKTIFFSTKVTEHTVSGHKILIATGYPYEVGKTTKVIDLKNADFACNLPDYPFEMVAGV